MKTSWGRERTEKVLDANGATGVNAIGVDAHLDAKTKLDAVGIASADIVEYASTVDVRLKVRSNTT